MGAAAIPIAVGAMVVSTAYSAYSAYQQSKFAKKAGERNAMIANQAAADAEQRGGLEASRVLSAGKRAMEKAKALLMVQGGQAAGGEGLQSVMEGMAINIETDAETVKNNAARQAWGYRNQADTARVEGEMASYRATQDMYGDLLGGAGKIAATVAMAKGGSKGGREQMAQDGLEDR